MVSRLKFVWLLTGAQGYVGWELTHATFYSGSDASGMMGKFREPYIINIDMLLYELNSRTKVDINSLGF
jgi:hypothetical protein